MRIKRTSAILILTSLCVLLFACAPKTKPYTREFFTMDTVISLTVYSDRESEAKAAMDEAEKEFFRINALCDRFSAESDLGKINKNAGVQPVKVSDDVFLMITHALDWAERTGGAFDIAVGPLMDLWNFGKENNSPPDDEKINGARANCSYKNVMVDSGDKTVFLTQKGMILDLGGIAKGYATDRAASLLHEAGVESAIINAGGNVYTIGHKPDGAAFRVGVQNPRDSQGILGVIGLSDQAAVSSGDYQRYYIYNGVRYHHILDPKTGYPARGLIATTVIGGSAETADVLSTAFFVLGAEKGLEMAQSLSEIDGALFVTEDKKISATSGISIEIDQASGFTLS